MSLLSRRRMLAVAAIVDVALHARPAPVAAKALAQRFALPPRHLETLLQALVHANILRGVRGPKGGYELARERRRISVGDIVRAVSDEDTEDHLPDVVSLVIAPAVADAGQDFMARLDTLSVAELCLKAEVRNADQAASGHNDFTI